MQTVIDNSDTFCQFTLHFNQSSESQYCWLFGHVFVEKKGGRKKLKYLSNQRQFFARLTEFSCIPKQSDNLSNVFIKIPTEKSSGNFILDFLTFSWFWFLGYDIE